LIVSGLSQRGMGWLVGGGGGAIWLVAVLGLYEADARSDSGGISSFWFVLWFALAATAFLIAMVLTTRPSTRVFGQGVLQGLATLLVAGIAVGFLQSVFTPS
jgi:hypothetical protein